MGKGVSLESVIESMHHEDKFNVVGKQYILERKPLGEVYKTIINDYVDADFALKYHKDVWDKELQEDYERWVHKSGHIRRVLLHKGTYGIIEEYFKYTDKALPELAYYSALPIHEWLRVVRDVLTNLPYGKGINDPYFSVVTDKLVSLAHNDTYRGYLSYERYKKKTKTSMYRELSSSGFVNYDTFLDGWGILQRNNKKLEERPLNRIVGNTYVIYLELCLGVAVDKPLSKTMCNVLDRVVLEAVRESPKLGDPKELRAKALKDRSIYVLDRYIYFGEKLVVVDWVTEKVKFSKKANDVRVKDIKSIVKWVTGE